MVYREETLLNVIRSVTRNGRSIILTAVLALILVYIFSVVGYVFFKDDFLMDVDTDALRKGISHYVKPVLGFILETRNARGCSHIKHCIFTKKRPNVLVDNSKIRFVSVILFSKSFRDRLKWCIASCGWRFSNETEYNRLRSS